MDLACGEANLVRAITESIKTDGTGTLDHHVHNTSCYPKLKAFMLAVGYRVFFLEASPSTAFPVVVPRWSGKAPAAC